MKLWSNCLLLASCSALVVVGNSGASSADAKSARSSSASSKTASQPVDDSVEIIEEWSNPEDKGKRVFHFQHKGPKYIVGIDRQIDAAYINNVRKTLLKSKGEHRPSLPELGITNKSIKQHRQEILDAAMLPLLRARIKDPEKYVQEPTLEVVSKVANRVRDEKPTKGLVTTNIIKFHGKPEIVATSGPMYTWKIKAGSDSWTAYSFLVSQQLSRLLALAYGGNPDDAKHYWTATFWQSEALWSGLVTKEGNKKIDDKIKRNLDRMFGKKGEAKQPPVTPTPEPPSTGTPPKGTQPSGTPPTGTQPTATPPSATPHVQPPVIPDANSSKPSAAPESSKTK